MSNDINSFVGQYTIRVGSSNKVGYQFQVGDKIFIGTGSHHAPVIQGETVGLSVFQGERMVFPPPKDEPAMFTFEAGNLVWRGTDPESDVPYMIQFSLIELLGDWGLFRSLYGAVLKTDPDVVAVWGADDQVP